LNDPNEHKEEDLDEEKVDENIAAINEAMKVAKFKKKDIAAMEIKVEETKKMKELVKVLDVMEEGITLIGGEKYATGSAVLPFVKKFNKVLEVDENEPLYMSKFKTDLKEDIKERCEKNLNRKVLAKASYFDKRFSNLKFLKNEEREEAIAEIKEELKQIEAETKEKQKESEEKQIEPKKKKRFLGAGLSDSDEEAEGFEEEVKKYDAETRLKTEGDPFEWWRQRKSAYPLMSKLARKYLPVQGTLTPAQRVMSRLGAILTKRRQRMSSDLFSEIMFLSDTM
jgi:hypothetical protein